MQTIAPMSTHMAGINRLGKLHSWCKEWSTFKSCFFLFVCFVTWASHCCGPFFYERLFSNYLECRIEPWGMRHDHRLKFCVGSFLSLLYLFSASVVFFRTFIHSTTANWLLHRLGAVLMLGLETDTFPVVKELIISRRRQWTKCAYWIVWLLFW